MTSLILDSKYPNTMHMFTDGSTRPNGCTSCAYLIYNEKLKSIVKMTSFAYRHKTINFAELMAINLGLDYPNMSNVIIYSDSTYAISCLTLWRKTWSKNNWMTPQREPVKNKNLIIEISKKIDSKKFVRFKHVKAHSGVEYNTVVDYLAQGLSKRMILDPNLPDGEYPAI